MRQSHHHRCNTNKETEAQRGEEACFRKQPALIKAGRCAGIFLLVKLLLKCPLLGEAVLHFLPVLPAFGHIVVITSPHFLTFITLITASNRSFFYNLFMCLSSAPHPQPRAHENCNFVTFRGGVTLARHHTAWHASGAQ